MPFLPAFIIALIVTGGDLFPSIILGIIGGFLLGVAWIFIRLVLGVTSMGLPDHDGRS